MRRIVYALVLVSAFWILVVFMQFRECRVNDEDPAAKAQGWLIKPLKKAIEIKDRELTRLHQEIARWRARARFLKTDDLDPQTHEGESDVPTIYIITPTYARIVQKAELTRLHNTLVSVPRVHWIVVEDASARTALVTRFLSRLKLKNVTHLYAPTPDGGRLSADDPNWLKPRGVLQRNEGLRWVRENAVKLGFSPESARGVVYFADDDNTYDLRLFEEMRSTKRASVWPVGIVGYLRYETPILEHGKVVSWLTYWKLDQRPFATDMAGFAVSLAVLLSHPEARFNIRAGRGQQESYLLQGLGLSLGDLEPKANMCTEILVWHTRTETPTLKNEAKMTARYGHGTDVSIEV